MLLKLQNQLAPEESDLRSQAWAAGLNLNTSSISNPSQVSFQKVKLLSQVQLRSNHSNNSKPSINTSADIPVLNRAIEHKV